jgi:hypothetical protein
MFIKTFFDDYRLCRCHYALAVFERKNLRKIYGPVKQNELWRIRRNDELEDVIKRENIVRFIKKPTNTMAWSHRKNAGHNNPQKDDVRKAVCNETQRKTKNEMADDVSTDLRKMEINEWRDRARDREVGDVL